MFGDLATAFRNFNATCREYRRELEETRAMEDHGYGIVHKAENGRLKAIIAELVAASENALHVLTPARPVMDGLDRTRMYLREAIAKATKP
jgi:hypothetical protein